MDSFVTQGPTLWDQNCRAQMDIGCCTCTIITYAEKDLWNLSPMQNTVQCLFTNCYGNGNVYKGLMGFKESDDVGLQLCYLSFNHTLLAMICTTGGFHPPKIATYHLKSRQSSKIHKNLFLPSFTELSCCVLFPLKSTEFSVCCMALCNY